MLECYLYSDTRHGILEGAREICCELDNFFNVYEDISDTCTRGLPSLIFLCERQPEVHIFDLEHNMGNMNLFLNLYNVKTK